MENLTNILIWLFMQIAPSLHSVAEELKVTVPLVGCYNLQGCNNSVYLYIYCIAIKYPLFVCVPCLSHAHACMLPHGLTI